MNKFIRLALFAAVIGNMSYLRAEEFHEHGAHEHGSAKLNIALEGGALYLEMDSPAVNFFGFEHPPINEEDEHLLAKVKAQLQQPQNLFTLPAAAACTVKETEVTSELFGDVATHNGEHDDHEGMEDHDADHDEHHPEHADVRMSYRFDCQSPAHLNFLELGLFAQFPLTRDVDVQIITDRGQTQLELHPENIRIDLQ